MHALIRFIAKVVHNLFRFNPEVSEHGRKEAYECIVPRAQNLVNKRLRQIYKGSEELVKPASLVTESSTR